MAASGELAETAGLSPLHFAKLFKRPTGVSPHRYLLERRLSEPRNCCENRPRAERNHFGCGFLDQTHRTKNVPQICGCPAVKVWFGALTIVRYEIVIHNPA
jgi:AraC-like DNA-binding protein